MYRLTHFVSCVLLIAMVAGCSGETPGDPKVLPPPEAAPAQRNVVLIVIDTLRADAITGERNGEPFMPRLRAFAEASAWYTNAISPSSWTKPSMVSMLSSQYPGVHNVVFGVSHRFLQDQIMELDAVPADLEMMASYMKTAGYATAAIQSNANLSPTLKFDQGFDSYYFEAYPEFRGTAVTDKAIEAWNKSKGPRFLYVHYMDPHRPYDPPEAYRQLMGVPDAPAEEIALLENFGSYYDEKVMFDLGALKARQMPELSEKAHAYIRALYAAETRYADDEVARLIEHVRTQDPNAIIVITADHGEELWEHGSIGHGKTLYQEVIHVPFILSVPGAPPVVINDGVSTIDLLPTIAEALGLPQRDTWQGLRLQTYAPSEPRPLFSMTKTSLQDLDKHWESVIVANAKLIVNEKTGGLEYYDLQADPGETANAAESNADAVEALKNRLHAHDEANKAHPQYRADAAKSAIDEELLEELRSQGYVRPE